ncbi:MAG: acyl-CoA thioesterase [Ferrovibrio sp.]|uniref:acyl-CoA thioesterase n=1 Tax=Ferrovibrio sp. TaxID=1917215 RepID=UPI0026393F6A|nr:thioesterase family protein [Ferrovibrio sp.]MCW0235033.1 acyl-CoA thioesterase [Ferrovibrio sp.]
MPILLEKSVASTFGVDGAWHFGIEVECCYGDLDPNQHVNNVRYLQWCEDAREAYFRALLGKWTLHSSYGIVLRALEFTFEQSLSIGDRCLVTARTAELKNTSFIQQYAVWKDGLVGTGKAVCIFFDRASNQKMAIPPDFRALITGLEGDSLSGAAN